MGDGRVEKGKDLVRGVIGLQGGVGGSESIPVIYWS